MPETALNSYLSRLDETSKQPIAAFAAFMAEHYPAISPRISYSMPIWWAGAKMYDGYVGISPAKKHFSVHFHSMQCLTELKAQLPGRTFGKRCINITYDDSEAFEVAKEKVLQYFTTLGVPH